MTNEREAMIEQKIDLNSKLTLRGHLVTWCTVLATAAGAIYYLGGRVEGFTTELKRATAQGVNNASAIMDVKVSVDTLRSRLDRQESWPRGSRREIELHQADTDRRLGLEEAETRVRHGVPEPSQAHRRRPSDWNPMDRDPDRGPQP